MAPQHVDIVFAVLAELALVRILQHATQRLEHQRAVELRGGTGVIVADRDVGRASRLHRDAQADEPGSHGIERIGLGVERERVSGLQACDPGVELFAREHGLVLARTGQRRIQRRGRDRRLACARCGRGRRRPTVTGLEIAQRLGEAVARVQHAQGIGIARSQDQRLGAAIERDVDPDRRQFPAQRQLLQRGTQVVADLALDPGRTGDHAVQRFVFGQPFGGRLGPAFGHARDVVDAVAHQRQHVDDLVGADAELVHHRRFAVHAAAAHRVDQGDAGPHELGEILVAGGNGDVDARLAALHRQGADHIVGLDARHAQDRKPQCLDDGAHRLDLGPQIVRHRRPVGLVVGVEIVAERAARRVDHEGRVIGRLLERRTQHVDHAEERARRLAVGVGQRRQRMEGAVEVGGTVDQD